MMIRISYALLSLFFVLLVSGCSDRPDPTEADVKAFFLQSSAFAPAIEQGRLTLNTFKLTSGKSRTVADKELYKAGFVANITIAPADCSNQPEADCGADTTQNKDIKGTAEFLWDNDSWSRAGLVLNQD